MEEKILSKTHCFQLKKGTLLSNEQQEEIAVLIYDTDPYIYPVLFGEGEQGIARCKGILPDVFESGKDAMFLKENLFVAEYEGRIVGLVLWCKGELVWDPTALLKTAREKGIPLVEKTVRLVSKEYVESSYSANSLPEPTILSLINVCIEKSMRNLGIGGALMRAFIAEHAQEEMQLCVLADNLPAIKLYENCGFKAVREEEGFALINPKPLCLTMIREPN